ncbi:hypothetical protein DFH06DRAFT_1327142 [Mycena polygramma]|nr:hypothetical protein DFH06DRAFT_1327142 [Mycena polygramma]
MLPPDMYLLLDAELPPNPSPPMPASATKNRFTAIGIHKVPAHLSLNEFRAKMEASADALVALPAAQKNCLKYDLMVPTDKLDSHNKALGFPAPQPVILVKVECETQEQCTQFLKDVEVANAISGVAKLGDTSMFSTEEHIPIDNGSTADALTWVGIFRCPAALSTAQFYDKAKENEGIFAALPISQKHILKLTLLFQNDAIANDLQLLGVSTTGSIVVAMIHGRWDGLLEIASHQGVKQFADELVKADLSANATCFSVDIVTKLDKN